MKKAKRLLLLLVVAPLGALAQSVSWNDPGPLVPNEPTPLELVFTDCQPSGAVTLPAINGLEVLGQPGRATSFSMINFQTSSSTTLSYVVRSTAEGGLQIAQFEVVTDKGKIKVPALSLNTSGSASPRSRAQAVPRFPFAPGSVPGAAQTPPAQAAQVPPGAAQAEAAVEPRNPYAGEVFDVNYRVFITGNRSGRVKTTPLWDVQNFSAEAWDRGQQIGPGGSKGLQFHTKAMIPKSGIFDLPPIRQKLDIETGAAGRSFFFTQPGMQEVEVSSDTISLQVQSLPGNAPTGFKGAVGQFSLESKMIPEQVNEGEPITWTLTLRGTGNWPVGVELPSRTVPTQMRTIQPKLRREFNGTEIFTGAIVEDLVMIPVAAGEFELPSVKFVYFDPKKKSYETIEAKPPKIVVTKGASGLSISTPTPSATSQASAPSGKQSMPSAIGRPNQPLQYGAPALPREPLEGKGIGFSPVAVGWLKLLSVLPWLVLLAAWWIWAKKRAVLTDPERNRKEALEAWKASVQRVRTAGEDADVRESSLLLWQKAVAGTLGIDGATPSWAEIARGTMTLTDPDRNNLEQCWQDSDKTLYGRNPSLDGDWCERASDLANRVDLMPLKFWEPARPRNLLPWISLLAVLMLGGIPLKADETKTAGNAVTSKEKAGDPIGLYRAGDFEGAATIWGERIRKKPSDPVARNNLALANFQLGDKERALAHGLAAYLATPSKGTVAWNARIFAGAANQLDPAMNRLWEDNWAAFLTSIWGVFIWQGILVLGITIAAFGVSLWLASGYFAFYRRMLFRVGSGVLLVGALMALVAGLALGVYGKLADRGAVMIVDVEPLRSVPTEVEPQAEKAYPPGSIAHLEKSFLGWSKIRLPNQDAGWIRTEHIVPLY